jgi:small subunit ribosomal protein S1
VHISELAQHHVENPREVVSQGDLVSAKIIEVDAERRRLSLSLKRVEGGGVTQRADDSEPVEGTPNLELSEAVFPEGAEPVAEPDEAAEPVAEAEAPAEEAPAEEEPAAEELLDESLEADAVAPDEPGPGDSEGEPPAAPE